jgi:hypothetical protein
MGLDVSLELRFYDKNDFDKFDEFDVMYMRKCYSIRNKIKDIVERHKVWHDGDWEYDVTNIDIIKEIYLELCKEEDNCKKKDYNFDSIWDINDYKEIIYRGKNNLEWLLFWMQGIISFEQMLDKLNINYYDRKRAEDIQKAEPDLKWEDERVQLFFINSY